MSKSIDPRERAKSHAEVEHVDFYAQALKASEQFREEYKGRLNVVKASQMPLERSPDGLIKHIINERMNTKECCLDMYQQFIPPGKATGKHRHVSEEVFYVVEGTMSEARAGVLNLSIPGNFEQHMPGIVEWFAEHPPGHARG